MSHPQRRPRPDRPRQPSPELVLAALERALRHRGDGAPAAPIWAILDHLAISRRSGAARHVRALLGELLADRHVAHSRPHGIDSWGLTEAGCGRLRRARRTGAVPPLPESPQHRDWRNAKAAGAQELVRFEHTLRERMSVARALLDADRPIASDAWFELADALRRACWRLGSASHCLYEWSEPEEDRADVDTRVEKGDEALDPCERSRRRARRLGRRNVRLWREHS